MLIPAFKCEELLFETNKIYKSASPYPPTYLPMNDQMVKYLFVLSKSHFQGKVSQRCQSSCHRRHRPTEVVI